MYRRYKPSRTKTREFAQTMSDISDFCIANGIYQSKNGDSYYFILNGIEYRVSNHSVESSNRGAYNDIGIQTRELYHENGREEGVIYIHASKTRIKDIYTDLYNGYVLDGRGRRK